MNTQALTKVRQMFCIDGVPLNVQRHNCRQWVKSIRHLGDKWLLAKKVQRVWTTSSKPHLSARTHLKHSTHQLMLRPSVWQMISPKNADQPIQGMSHSLNNWALASLWLVCQMIVTRSVKHCVTTSGAMDWTGWSRFKATTAKHRVGSLSWKENEPRTVLSNSTNARGIYERLFDSS